MEIFNTHLEFNRDALFQEIDERIKEHNPGYVCVCDSSVISRLQHDMDYRRVINGSFINTCDGSSIALMAKMLYGGNPQVNNGPQIFDHYTKQNIKQLVLGNTEEIYDKVVNQLKANGDWQGQMLHMPLPFAKVDEFDYKGIAEKINEISPDIIWVSLGNPKQEIFASRITPYVNKGVLFGIGAALNFWCGDLKLPNPHIGPLKFIWFTRMFQDPKRQIKGNWRVLKALPSIYYQEWKRKRKNNK